MYKRRALIGVTLFMFASLLYLYSNTWKIYVKERIMQVDGIHATVIVRPTSYNVTAESTAKNISSDRHEENVTVKTLPIHPTTAGTTCVKGYAQKLLMRLIPEFNPEAHLFLEPGYKEWKDLIKSKYPYGYEDTAIIDRVLKLLPAAGKPDRFGDNKETCRRCLMIGNSGVSLGKRLGNVIDNYDVVIRMNDAPIVKYEADLGKKTTFRMIYPESSTFKLSPYENDTDILFLIYKPNDIKWLEAILKKEDPTKMNISFWKSVAKRLTIPADRIRIVSPGIHNEGRHQHLSVKARPSCGLVALVLAIHYCDHVDITGYGYDIHFPVHYYRPGVAGVLKNGVHSWSEEKIYILKLLYCGVIGKDLTGYYAKEAERWGFTESSCLKV